MKKRVSMILAAILLLISICAGMPAAYAEAKSEKSRTIAIVFDNSGTMYLGDEDSSKTWCRATYAMQVLATMMNPSDVMQIYPMNPIQIGEESKPAEDKVFTSDKPLVIKKDQAGLIQEICTPTSGDTHIEALVKAREGLSKAKADEKWLIVLTDGTVFYRNGKELSEQESIKQLTEEFNASLAQVNTMYLGIGAKAQSGFEASGSYQYVERKATNSAEVLANLTQLGNIIFGRDILPMDSKTVEFDISMKKLILFVQGENIDNVKLSGQTPISTDKLQYSTYGNTYYKNKKKQKIDTTLQGTMLTYENLDAGSYEVSFDGMESDITVYYEPDVEMDFIFTNLDGSVVDADTLYADEYMVSYGMKDAKTGELTESALLGNPHYVGAYYINGEEFPITHDGCSGSVPVVLNAEDLFEATLTVTYLSGYTITRSTLDFGWPADGIRVKYKPAGDLMLEISGGDEAYPLQSLESGAPFIAKVYADGEQLTGSELEKVSLKWDPDTSNAEIKKAFADDHWELNLCYKDPEAPQDTLCGECTVTIYAYYSKLNTSEAVAECPLTYTITDDVSLLAMDLHGPEKDIIIRELDDSEPLVAYLTVNGEPIAAEEFGNLQLLAETGGIEYTVKPDAQNSAYLIELQYTEGIEKGNYRISATAQFKDRVGRITEASDTANVTLRTMPAWMRLLIALILLLLLIIIIIIILRIRVLPKYAHTTRKLSTMSFDGDDVSTSANFLAEIKKRGAKVQSQYAGKKFGISMDVAPGKQSFLSKGHKRRSAEVKPASVKKFGSAKIQEVMIGSAKYVADENTGKLAPVFPNQKPFLLVNGMMVKYSGTIEDAGIDKDFVVTSKLNFLKK